MAAKEEVVSSSLDTVKLGLAVAVLLAGVVGFYYYADQSLLYRVLGLVALAVLAVGITLTTALGHNTWEFLQESRTEVRKMVWPTRTETVQTTLIVIAMVIIVGIFLWLLDMLLAWLVRFVIG